MKRIDAVATVDDAGMLSLHVPTDVAPGEHRVTVELPDEQEGSWEEFLDELIIPVESCARDTTFRRAEIYAIG